MITIRKAVRADLKTLIDFQIRLAWESENVALDANILEKGISALFDDPNRGAYYVAMRENEVVACHMITYEWSDWRNGMVWWIQSVFVNEAYRQQGIFRAMYENLRQIVKADPGLVGIRLYVDNTNVQAQKTYVAMGMNGEHYSVFEWMK